MIHRATKFSQEQGVTLLLAILVLAAITAIAFSLAAIILVEIRSSGDVTRTEPALYGAQGLTEEAFFKYQRSLSDSSLDLSTFSLNGVTLTSQLKAFDQAPRIDTIPVGTTRNYLFIDPTRPSDFNTKVYNSISFTALNSVSSTSATVSRCCDSSGNTVTVQTYTLPASTTNTYNVNDTSQYILTITNNNTTTPLLVQIDPVKVTSVTGCGTHCIPLLGKVLGVNASYAGLTRKYSITAPVGTSVTAPPPAPTLTSQDIGAVGVAGSTNLNNGTYTITASGVDIWDVADAFRYIYEPWSGDGTIIAKINSVAYVDDFTMAGVMFRDSLNANAREVSMMVMPSGKQKQRSRDTTGGATLSSGPGAGNTLPEWVKIVRQGNTFTTYVSSDGNTWQQPPGTAPVTISMGNNVYVGIAVTSHNNSTLTTAVVSNFSAQ